MERKRSVGVTVIGIFAIILGGLFIVQGLMVIIGLPVVLTKTEFKPDANPCAIYVMQIIGLLYSVSLLISGIGILKLKL